ADQRLLAAFAVLDEAGHIAALAHLRHLQLQRAQPCIPSAFPVSIAISRAFLAALVRLRPDLGGYLRLHTEVGDHLRHCPNRVLRFRCSLHELVCQLVAIYPLLGHPLSCSFRESSEYFHWSQQRMALVKTLIYTQDFTRPPLRRYQM